jgi:hypothetical protein
VADILLLDALLFIVFGAAAFAFGVYDPGHSAQVSRYFGNPWYPRPGTTGRRQASMAWIVGGLGFALFGGGLLLARVVA